MSDMPLSEKTLRAAALACWENAESLSAEAKLLGDHQYGARAVALAILGLEEFAKAIGYTVAALSREPRDVLVRKLRHLTSHEVKHLVAWTAEYAQIVKQDWIDGVEWQTGYRPSAEGRFAAQLSHLAQGGLGYFLEEPREARTFFQTRREMKRATPSGLAGEDIDVLLASDKKNAALYVDLAPDGQLKTPSRVADDATSEILGLDWFIEQYADLPSVLKDDAAWTRLAMAVRL